MIGSHVKLTIRVVLCSPAQFRVFTAPFHRVEFADFWLADQLNSLVIVLMDLEYLVCFYSVELQWGDVDGLLPNYSGTTSYRTRTMPLLTPENQSQNTNETTEPDPALLSTQLTELARARY